MAKYRARLHIEGNTCWHTDVPVRPGEELTDAEIQRRARRAAVSAFGLQAAGWTLIDATLSR